MCRRALKMWEKLSDADVCSFKEELRRRLPWLPSPPGFKVGNFQCEVTEPPSISFTCVLGAKEVRVAVDADDDAVHPPRDDGGVAQREAAHFQSLRGLKSR